MVDFSFFGHPPEIGKELQKRKAAEGLVLLDQPREESLQAIYGRQTEQREVFEEVFFLSERSGIGHILALALAVFGRSAVHGTVNEQKEGKRPKTVVFVPPVRTSALRYQQATPP